MQTLRVCVRQGAAAPCTPASLGAFLAHHDGTWRLIRSRAEDLQQRDDLRPRCPVLWRFTT